MERLAVEVSDGPCPRPNNRRFKGPVTYTESQLRKFGLILEGRMKINHVFVVYTDVTVPMSVVSEVERLDANTVETRLHPTHPSHIDLVSQQFVEPQQGPVTLPPVL